MALVITLIIVGLMLLLVEVYFTPGTSISGILGILAIIWANILAFQNLPSPIAWITLIVSFIITVLFLILLFRMLSSKNFVVKKEIKSKVNVIDEKNFSVGERGRTTTSLRPNGRAIFKDSIYEVFSQGNYIEVDQEIEITKITTDKIFVKSI